MLVNIYDLHTIQDEKLKYAVIVCSYKHQIVMVRHKQRTTIEIPGGHRERGESIMACAKRELWEETGAVNFDIQPRYVYGVKKDGEEESFGMLYTALITSFEDIPITSEIKERMLYDELPNTQDVSWTYPWIQPYLYEAVKQYL